MAWVPGPGADRGTADSVAGGERQGGGDGVGGQVVDGQHRRTGVVVAPDKAVVLLGIRTRPPDQTPPYPPQRRTVSKAVYHVGGRGVIGRRAGGCS